MDSCVTTQATERRGRSDSGMLKQCGELYPLERTSVRLGGADEGSVLQDPDLGPFSFSSRPVSATTDTQPPTVGRQGRIWWGRSGAALGRKRFKGGRRSIFGRNGHGRSPTGVAMGQQPIRM